MNHEAAKFQVFLRVPSCPSWFMNLGRYPVTSVIDTYFASC